MIIQEIQLILAGGLDRNKDTFFQAFYRNTPFMMHRFCGGNQNKDIVIGTLSKSFIQISDNSHQRNGPNNASEDLKATPLCNPLRICL